MIYRGRSVGCMRGLTAHKIRIQTCGVTTCLGLFSPDDYKPYRVNGQLNMISCLSGSQPQALDFRVPHSCTTVRRDLSRRPRPHHDQWRTAKSNAIAAGSRNRREIVHFACRPCTIASFPFQAQPACNQQSHQQRCNCPFATCS